MLLLKRAAYNLLCNGVTGTVLLKLFRRIPDMRWRGYKFYVNPERSNKRIISSIFFGFYESSEIRLIHRYYNGKSDVIELGGSMGIVSSHLASIMDRSKKLVVVEANPFLSEVIGKNIKQHKQDNFNIVQAAVAYTGTEVHMAISMNNTASRLAGEAGNGTMKIPAVTLSGIVDANNLDSYTLVCDIEGGEASILLNDRKALDKCVQLFIELHDTEVNNTRLSVNDLAGMIESCGFERTYNEGPVYYFTRTTNGRGN